MKRLNTLITGLMIIVLAAHTPVQAGLWDSLAVFKPSNLCASLSKKVSAIAATIASGAAAFLGYKLWQKCNELKRLTADKSSLEQENTDIKQQLEETQNKLSRSELAAHTEMKQDAARIAYWKDRCITTENKNEILKQKAKWVQTKKKNLAGSKKASNVGLASPLLIKTAIAAAKK